MSGEPLNCASVLIVEDDPAIRESLGAVLDLQGYHHEEAANGEEALDQLRHLPKPCLILLDLMMPIMNGWEFLQKVEKDVVLAQIPIAVVSAFPAQADGLKVKTVMKKPIDLPLLLQVVESYCGLPWKQEA